MLKFVYDIGICIWFDHSPHIEVKKYFLHWDSNLCLLDGT